MSDRIHRRGFLQTLAGGALYAGCGGASKLAGPFARAPACTATACTMVDIHTHIFNASDLPIEGFITHVAPVPEALTRDVARKLHEQLNARAPSGAQELEMIAQLPASAPIRQGAPGRLEGSVLQLAARLGAAAPASLRDAASTTEDIIRTLAMITKPRYQIAAELIETYPSVDLFTPALVDYAYWAKGDAETSLVDQLRVQEAISKLSVQQRFARPEARIHPFAPFNPLREVRECMDGATAPYAPLGEAYAKTGRYTCGSAPPAEPLASAKGALAPLRAAIERHGFIGAKVYPPSGFLPADNASWEFHAHSGLGAKLDAALSAFYAYCEAEDVPVMAHANNSNGYDLGYGTMAEPKRWESVLRRYPNLRLNLGHFGHMEGVDPKRGVDACEAWMRQAAVLMQRYPNVYADTGNSPLAVDSEYGPTYLSALESLMKKYPRVKERLMYGTDWWMNKLGPNTALFADAFHEAFSDSFEDDASLLLRANALRFLGASTPGRAKQRLLALYAGRPTPSWLA